MQCPGESRLDGEPRRRVTRTTSFFIALATLSATGLAWRDGGTELLDAITDAAWLVVSIVPVIGGALAGLLFASGA